MKDARTELKDSVVVLDNFDPKAYENAEPPLVSIYLPIHRTEREDRRDEWDKVEFKDLKEEAERTLHEKFPKEEDWAGIAERLNYLLEKEDLPLWLNAGKSLGMFITNTNVYAFNLDFDVKPAVMVSDTFYVKPLLRNWQYGTKYYILELGNDRFSWVEGNRNGVKRQQLPKEVHDYFSQLFADSDETYADERKDEEGALDFVSLEGHMSPYHDHQSRKEVSKEEFEQFARYVNKAVDDYLVDKDTTPIILCCAPEQDRRDVLRPGRRPQGRSERRPCQPRPSGRLRASGACPRRPHLRAAGRADARRPRRGRHLSLLSHTLPA